MAFGQVDPARLSGEALRRWYLRTPAEIEEERQAIAARRHREFFGRGRDADPGFGKPSPGANPDPAFSVRSATPGFEIDPGFNRGPSSIGDTDLSKVSAASQPQQALLSHLRSGPMVEGSETADPYASRYRTLPVTSDQSGPLGKMPAQATAPVARVAFNNKVAPARTSATPSRATSTYFPGMPPKASFFSYMFGGPAPLRGPGGKVIGYYDHDAGKVGMQITGVYASIAPFFVPSGWMEVVGTKAATPLVQAVDNGILEALQRHHPVPLHMGGRWLQELAPLRQSLHTELHSALRAALKEAGLPNVGGRGGARADWAKYFEANPESYNEALEILQRTTREFDKAKGTNISSFLERELTRMGERTKGKGP